MTFERDRLLHQLLQQVEQSQLSAEEALARWHEGALDAHASPGDSVHLDLSRGARLGFPEVIYGEGKTPDQLEQAIQGLLERGQRILVTRVEEALAAPLRARFSALQWHEKARALTAGEPGGCDGLVNVIAAGSSDLGVAEEACVTATVMGARVRRIYDVGVAGLHRLLGRLDELRDAQVHIVVAGMEGALPSVLGGLVSRPLIAVPTSVGYGASFQGLSALLGMLSSCAPGVVVVNIDNGFGAGFAACRILGSSCDTHHQETKGSQ